ncbi:hypothetical protein CHGG_03399 [Chaetomium globosum CBS 148.51]|uniref:Uncharacterized protein n=1 Tax=Chaetomium globosum (strain ATCC 6205 / CBS 148.51 / DSM 1962 / NBRC 6347 / NRRL 1970) TaxID=306901 RepID=Q2H8Q5_CHAGB|nr:uncharacterized protein CHGG_03399 [Chaetomium globosum CBS 148.51]EAQ91464.1 hypothetical protein CHGG_03399 [Chaetomium globosum CBS 148.51]
MSQNNNTGGYSDPDLGDYTQGYEDATIVASFNLVEDYLREEAAGNHDVIHVRDIDSEDDDSEDDDNKDGDHEDDDNYNEMKFDGADFHHEDAGLNDINLGFDIGNNLFPSPPAIVESPPTDGIKGEDDEELFGKSPIASDASQGAPTPAVPSDMSTLAFPQTDPVIAASHPPQAPEPSSSQPTLTLPQLDPAEVPDFIKEEPGLTEPDYTSLLPIDPLIASEASNASQPSAPARVPDPQSYLPAPEISTGPSFQSFVPPQEQIPEPALAVPNNEFFYPCRVDNDTTNSNQGQYPLGPLLGQGNGTSPDDKRAGRLRRPIPVQQPNPYNNSAYPMPLAQCAVGQYDAYSNTQAHQRFIPSEASRYRQSMGPQNPGYRLPLPQNATPPMNLEDIRRLPPINLPLPVSNHAAYPPQRDPLAPQDQPHPLNRGRISHRRSRKASSNNDSQRFYVRPPRIPAWGPLVPGPRQPEPVFRYYKHYAELRPALTFTADQLVTFFLGIGHPNPGRRLTLWIQNVAAQSNDRYANRGASTKCRYKNCPAKQNTILKGFFRIAFDEFSDMTGDTLDPMHNAGYMHLHCFEKLFDLGYLIHYGATRLGFRILPDRRIFNHETRNAASLTRDHGDMINAYDEWVEGQRARADYIESVNANPQTRKIYTGIEPMPHMIPPHSQRLGYKLVEKHLSLQVKGRAATRDNRGGPHIGIHMGDLDLLMHLKRRAKQRRSIVPGTQQETQQGTQQVATATTITYAAAQGAGQKRAHDDGNGEGSSSVAAEQRPAQRLRVDGNTQQAQYEPPTTRGTKRAIDDLESSSTSPESSKRARDSSYQTPDFLDPENYYDLFPMDVLEGDNINVAFGDDDALYDNTFYVPGDDDEPEMGYAHTQPNWYPQPPSSTTTPPTTTTAAATTSTTTTPTPAYPRTRSRSREESISIINQLTPHHLTRASAHAIQSQLEAQPAHVREQVLAAVPAEYAALVQPPTQDVSGLPWVAMQKATSDPSLPGIGLPPLTEGSQATLVGGKPDRWAVSGDGSPQVKTDIPVF